MNAPSPAAEPRRIPTEFRYWERLPDARSQRLREGFRKLLHFDPVLDDAIVRRYAETYFDADPVAEAFVEEVYLQRGQAEGRALLDRALEQGVASIPDAPASLRALFAEIEAPPAWYDEALAEQGARAIRRYGTHYFSFAGAVTLESYKDCSVAKPLAFTGAYAGESAHRRFLETVAFWLDITTPGAMRPGGKGRKTALRVRIMHVFVRRRLLAHPRWDLEAWGVPISQADALLTLLAGSVGAGLGLQKLGYRTSHEDIEAMMHFWRYVGHLMGVQPPWYPETYEDGARLMFTSMIKGAGLAGEDGVNLARSYVASYAPPEGTPPWPALLRKIEQGIELGYTHFFLPPKTYRGFDLPAPGLWKLHPFAQFPAVFALETLRRRVPLVDDLALSLSRWKAERWLAAHLGPRRAEYKAVESFTR
jgi:hypothetical protein